MDTYTILRAFADSWMLLAMFLQDVCMTAAIWQRCPKSSKTPRRNSNDPRLCAKFDESLSTKLAANTKEGAFAAC